MVGTSKEVLRTPLGWAGVAVSRKGVVRIVLPRKSRRAVEQELNETVELNSVPAGSSAFLKNAVKLMKQALSGKPVDVALPLDLGRYTQFQRDVWRATAKIPFSKTRSYAWIAERIGMPKAARAVGQAMGANPVPILIP